MWKIRIIAVLILIVGLGTGYFVYSSQVDGSKPFKLGLDLSGGTHLVYSADTSSIPANETEEAMDALRDVVERRVNLFGVAEPIVQIERPSILSEDEKDTQRLIVELPGITDVEQAVAMIGETPVLEFMTVKEDVDFEAYVNAITEYEESLDQGLVPEKNLDEIFELSQYVKSELTGRFLSRASLQFEQSTGDPYIQLNFNSEGADLFAQITKENVGKPVAVFLDRHLGNIIPITEPTVQQEITGGEAIITGSFTPEEAKILAGRLNSGALPVVTQMIKERYVDKPIYDLIVLPFEHEETTEERAIYNTALCLKSASSIADAIILVDNQRFIRKCFEIGNLL